MITIVNINGNQSKNVGGVLKFWRTNDNKEMVPKNFSWLEKGRVAGLGFPGSDDELRYLVDAGVSALVSLTEEKVLNTDRVQGDAYTWL